MEYKNLKVGNRCGDGGIGIILKYKRDLGINYLGYVLCLIPQKGEFVTWMYNHSTNSAAHGHYYFELEKALKDYNKRG